MFAVELFLGFPVDALFADNKQEIDPQVVALFVQNGDEYLQDVMYKDKRYFGKFAGKINDLAALELLEEHIYSLLKKIVPSHNFEKKQLSLFPAPSKS